MKICNKCMLPKDESEFSFRKDQQKYRLNCKKCCRIAGKKWEQTHRDRVAFYHKKYRATNPGESTKRVREWRHANPDKVTAEYKRYRVAHPDKVIAGIRRHEARKRGATISDFSVVDWQSLLRIFNYHCAYCHKDITEIGKLTQDHIIPLSRGGDHIVTNVLPACLPCNGKKGTRLLEEWDQFGRSI